MENTMNRFTKLDADFQPLAADATGHTFVLDNVQNLIFTVENIGGDDVPHAKATELAAECRLGDKADWRLPTVEELFLVADRSKFSPAIDEDFFPGTESDWYWTSTPAAWSADCAWIVGFDGGCADGYRRYNGGFVRAVRSAVPAGQ
jgi:hypothetical protein